MTFPGYLIETSVVDPVTGEPVFGNEPVVPEQAQNLLETESNQGGCCGGGCCQ